MLFSCCCASTEAYMYTLGGSTGASFPAGVQTADKSAMTSGTTSAVSSANLSSNRAQHCGFGNPGVAGYLTGGVASIGSGTELTSTDKTDTSTDTTSACGTATLSLARAESSALAERTTKAYVIAGGKTVAGTFTAQVTADKFDYSSESFSATTSADVTTAVKYPAAMYGTSSKGYIAGGFRTTVVSAVVTAYKLTFSGDSTSAQSSANLSTGNQRFALGAGGDGSTKGYWAGGQAGSPVDKTDKLTFSTDTTSTTTIGAGSRNAMAYGSDGTILFLTSGSTSDASNGKITFSTDVLATFGSGSAGNLSSARTAPAGFTTAAL